MAIIAIIDISHEMLRPRTKVEVNGPVVLWRASLCGPKIVIKPPTSQLARIKMPKTIAHFAGSTIPILLQQQERNNDPFAWFQEILIPWR
jgi:hypothetical protein